MGIKSNNPAAPFFNVFGASGHDAGNPSATTYTEATGGMVSDYTDPTPGTIYRAHIFSGPGTFTVSSVGSAAIGGVRGGVEYLVVGGGGGGGSASPADVGGSGGGAGGFRTNVSGHPLAGA